MPLTVSLDTRQLDRYAKGLERVSRDLPNAIDRAVNLTANQGKRPITEKTPKITGNLKRGFQVARLAVMRWRIFNLVEYFMFIETGQRRSRTGKTIFRRAGPANALKRSISEIGKLLDRNVTVVLRRLLARKS